MHRPLTIVLVILTALACLALVYLQRIGLPLPAAAAKMLASAGFVATALSAGAGGSRYGRILLAGLLLSWFGDALLIGTSRQLFLAGLAGFLAAHIVYIGAFLVNGLNVRWLVFSAMPLVAVAILVTAWLTPQLPPGIAWPVHAYTIVITMMVVCAFGARGAGAPALVPLGAVLFFVSDLSVAAMRIAGSDLPMYVWGLPAYYAGQLCLAASCRRAADP